MDLKVKAIKLRKRGSSIRNIESKLGISKSTLSGWFKEIKLSNNQIKFLDDRRKSGLVKARKKAALFHRKAKLERFKMAQINATLSINELELKNKHVLKLALAMLFAGEGFKAAEETSLGNSDTKIVYTFLELLDQIYGINKDKMRLYLHLRADQNVILEKKYWSNALEIEQKYFKIAAIDKRTLGKPTYATYHGVCVVRYYDVSIKRELLAIADSFFGIIAKKEL